MWFPEISMSSGEFRCSLCPGKPTFPNFVSLEEHVATEHYKISPYQCLSCYSVFGTEGYVIQHGGLFHNSDFEFKFHYRKDTVSLLDQIKKDALMQLRIKEEFDHNQPGPSTRKRKSQGEPEGEELNLSKFDVDSIARRLDIQNELKQQKLPVSTGEEDEEEEGNKLTCRECGEKVPNTRSSLFYHANTKHIKFVAFECLGCDKKYYSFAIGEIRNHIKKKHGADKIKQFLVDNRSNLQREMRFLVGMCFPDMRKSDKFDDSPKPGTSAM